MKIETLTPEEMKKIDEIKDPMTIGEICDYLPWIRVGIKLDNGDLVGSLILFNVSLHSRKAEIGVHVIDPRGTLVAYKAFKQFVKDAFELMELNRIYARIHYDNKRCISCIKRSGFSLEGVERQSLFVCGEYKDIQVWSIIRSDLERGG